MTLQATMELMAHLSYLTSWSPHWLKHMLLPELNLVMNSPT